MENVVIASFDPTVFGIHTLSDLSQHRAVKWAVVTRDYPRLCTAHLALKVPIVLMSSSNIRKYKKAGAFPKLEAVYYDPFVRNWHSEKSNLSSEFASIINREPTDEEMVRYFQRMHNIAKKQYVRPTEHKHQPKATPMSFDSDDEEVQGSVIRWSIRRADDGSAEKVDKSDKPEATQDICGLTSDQFSTQCKILHNKEVEDNKKKLLTGDTLEQIINKALMAVEPSIGLMVLQHLKFHKIPKELLTKAISKVVDLANNILTYHEIKPNMLAMQAYDIYNTILSQTTALKFPEEMYENGRDCESAMHAAWLILYPNFYLLDRILRFYGTTETDDRWTSLLISETVLNELDSLCAIESDFKRSLQKVYLRAVC